MDKKVQEIYEAYESVALKYDEALWEDAPYNDQIDKFISLVKGKDILDVGCAMGSFTKYVADKGFFVDAFDLCPKMIEIAKSKVNNVNFFVMNMLEMNIDKKYDGLMIINSTIHIEKDKMFKLFKSFYNLLKEDGILFIILQEGEGEQYVTEPLDPSIEEFVSFYHPDEIEELFNSCGFFIIDREEILDENEFELGNNQLVYYLKKN